MGCSQIPGSQNFTYQYISLTLYFELQADPKMKGAIIGLFVVTLACLFFSVSSKLTIIHLRTIKITRQKFTRCTTIQKRFRIRQSATKNYNCIFTFNFDYSSRNERYLIKWKSQLVNYIESCMED